MVYFKEIAKEKKIHFHNTCSKLGYKGNTFHSLMINSKENSITL